MSFLQDIYNEKYLNVSHDFVVAYDEIDFMGRLKPSALLQYFQDLVEIHARALSITHEQMAERGMFWVLSRLRTDIEFYPKVGDIITAVSFPHKPGIAEAQRSFYLALGGRIFARAISKWCVLDLETKRICKLKGLFEYADEKFCPQFAADFPPRSMIARNSNERQWENTFKVNISDLDKNFHMNNARYADILLNMCDIDRLKKYDIASFDIRFLSELRYGDQCRVIGQSNGDQSEFEGFVNDKNAFLAYLVWRNRLGEDN